MKRRVVDKLKTGCREDSPQVLCRDAIAAFNRADGMPPEQLRKEINTAEKALVRLRDCLIDHQRASGGTEIARRFELDQVNTALTLVAGIEYPSSRINRSYMESARKLLDRVERELTDLG